MRFFNIVTALGIGFTWALVGFHVLQWHWMAVIGIAYVLGVFYGEWVTRR